MHLAPQVPNIDDDVVQKAEEAIENGSCDLTTLPTTLVQALITPLRQLSLLAEEWESKNAQAVELTDALRANLREAKKHVGRIVRLIDKSLTLAQNDEQINVLMHVIANDLKSRIILIYSGAELMIDEHPDSISLTEVKQLLSFMIKGLHRSLLYIDKIISLDGNVTMKTLHPWRS